MGVSLPLVDAPRGRQLSKKSAQFDRTKGEDTLQKRWRPLESV